MIPVIIPSFVSEFDDFFCHNVIHKKTGKGEKKSVNFKKVSPLKRKIGSNKAYNYMKKFYGY